MSRTPTYAERVNVLKKVQINGQWKFVPVLDRKGKIVRDHVLVAGRDEHHPEGSYYIEWYEEGSRRKQCVGDFENVLAAARDKSPGSEIACDDFFHQQIPLATGVS